MASEFDETDFVDNDFQGARKSLYTSSATLPGSAASGGSGRPPTQDELDTKVSDTQQRLAALKREQEQLERERAALEEARRRRVELQTGRSEMLTHLARGLGLLEENEFAARRDAEQMAKTITDFKDALAKVQAIQEDLWTEETWNIELTRALTTIENARMEWNAARLKWLILSPAPDGERTSQRPQQAAANPWSEARTFGELCKMGLALTWPLAVVALAIFLVLLLRR